MDLSICHLSSRKDSKVEWFFDSLAPQVKPEDNLTLIVIDFWSQAVDDWTQDDADSRRVAITEKFNGAGLATNVHLIISPPKPGPWQGPHRLTKQNWFAAANARNTALCLCRTDWIAYVDDLSVLAPTWLEAVRCAHHANYVVFGAYKKLRKMVVEKGVIVSCEEFAGGLDSRLRHVGELVSCGGDWGYGCSQAGPTEAYLCVNGWPEAFDGLSFEDVCMGICIGNTNRFSFRYNKLMLTCESEEDHYKEKPMIRSDFGVSPRDKSHAALNIAKQSKWFPNFFGDEGIRGLRDRILRGEEFPIVKIPDREWFTGKLLSDL